MKNAKILITGRAGFIGSHLLKYCKARVPAEVIIGVDVADLDLLNREAVRDFLQRAQPDFIFQMASLFNAKDLLITENIFECLKDLKLLSRVVVPGSAAEYGAVAETAPIDEKHPLNPISMYGKMKALQTALVRKYCAHDMDAVIGRIFNVLAPDALGNSAVGAFAMQIREKKESGAPISVGNLEATRDYLSIDDVCAALVAIAQSGKTGGVYNICSGVPVKMSVLLEQMLKLSGARLAIEVDPAKLRTDEIPYSCGSNAKLRADTGWAPTQTIDQTLREILR